MFVLTISPRQHQWCVFGGAGALGYPPKGGLQRVLPWGGPGRAGCWVHVRVRERVRVLGSLGHAEQPCGLGEMGGSAPPSLCQPPPAGVSCCAVGLGAAWCRGDPPL